MVKRIHLSQEPLSWNPAGGMQLWIAAQWGELRPAPLSHKLDGALYFKARRKGGDSKNN